MKTRNTALVLAHAFLSGGVAYGLTADVLELGADPKTAPLFTYIRTVVSSGDGGHEELGVFKDRDGKIAVEEKISLTASGDLISYEMNQHQVETKGSVTISGGKVHFSFEKDGKAKTADEDAVANLIVGPTLVPYLQKNWVALKKGNSIKARFAVPDRRETVGFKFSLVDEAKDGERKTARIKMSASSFLIAALINPLYFTFTDDGSKLLNFEGRTLLKQKLGGAWGDLDARTVYKD